jgi:hypothetical protein
MSFRSFNKICISLTPGVPPRRRPEGPRRGRGRLGEEAKPCGSACFPEPGRAGQATVAGTSQARTGRVRREARLGPDARERPGEVAAAGTIGTVGFPPEPKSYKAPESRLFALVDVRGTENVDAVASACTDNHRIPRGFPSSKIRVCSVEPLPPGIGGISFAATGQSETTDFGSTSAWQACSRPRCNNAEND